MDGMDLADYVSKYDRDYVWLIFAISVYGAYCGKLALTAIPEVRATKTYRRNWVIYLGATVAATLFFARFAVLVVLFPASDGFGLLRLLPYVPFWIGFAPLTLVALESLWKNRPTYCSPDGSARSDREIILTTLRNYAVLGPIVFVWLFCLRRGFPGLEYGILTPVLMAWWIQRLSPQLLKRKAVRYGLFAFTMIVMYFWLDFTIVSTLERVVKYKKGGYALKWIDLVSWLTDQPALGLAIIPVVVGLLRIERQIGSAARARAMFGIAACVVICTCLAVRWK